MGSRQPASVSALERRAYAALQQGELALAEELLLRLIAVGPDNPAYAERLATLYQRRGQHGLAIAFAQRAAALDAEDPHLARLLGLVLEAGGEPDLPREAYLAAVDVGGNARHPAGWLALSRLERAQGRLETAEQYARQAVEAAPHAPEAYAELGRVLLHAGHPAQARAAVAIGLRLAPTNGDLLALHDAISTAAKDPDGEEGRPTTDPI